MIGENLDAFHMGTAPPERLEIRPRRWVFTAEASLPVTLPAPYWHHMRAETEGGAPVALAPEPLWGRVTFEAPPGERSIIVSLPLHWSEWTGFALSLAGLAGCIGIGARGQGGFDAVRRIPCGHVRDLLGKQRSCHPGHHFVFPRAGLELVSWDSRYASGSPAMWA